MKQVKFHLNSRTRIPPEYQVRFRVGLDNRQAPVGDWYFDVLKKTIDEPAWISVVLNFFSTVVCSVESAMSTLVYQLIVSLWFSGHITGISIVVMVGGQR